MQKIKFILRSGVLYAAAIVLVGAAPMTAYAEDGANEPPENYTYDASTGRWNSTKWVYDPASNTYVPAPKPASTPPSETVKTPTEQAAGTTESDKAAPAGGGNTSADNTVKSDNNTSIGNNLSADNTVNSAAKTGNAGVKQNSSAGGAATGDAAVDVTVINAVHSTVQGDTAGVAHFSADINGDVTGDIMLSPAIDGATASSNTTVTDKTTVNNNTDLTNNLNLNATSGNADVNQNTLAGDATTGNATTIANVINLINTIIAANKSFVGTINIYGNLDGDILISPEFIPQLLASNASTASSVDTSLSASLSDNQQIINNIKLNAESGGANVADNTGAGSATTGTSNTNLTVLNLTGHEVDASNSLLVFVNVMGTWVGMIVDAPGATAAMIGSGVNSSTKTTLSSELAADNNARITNNLNLDARTGNASVTENTGAGSAKSGNAYAAANIANISTTKFKLSDWFGVLFINVFGKWHGSFGIDTEAGNVVALAGDATPPPRGTALATGPLVRFGFVPTNGVLYDNSDNQPIGAGVAGGSGGGGTSEPQVSPEQAALIKSYLENNEGSGGETLGARTSPNAMTNTVMMTVGSAIVLAGAATALTDRNRIHLGRRFRS